MDILDGGDNEKGLIITARYWGLGFSVSEVLWIGITRKQTVTPLGKVFWIEIWWHSNSPVWRVYVCVFWISSLKQSFLSQRLFYGTIWGSRLKIAR